jgi:glutathionyl-hydroquinone reductase
MLQYWKNIYLLGVGEGRVDAYHYECEGVDIYVDIMIANFLAITQVLQTRHNYLHYQKRLQSSEYCTLVRTDRLYRQHQRNGSHIEDVTITNEFLRKFYNMLHVLMK